MKRWRVLTTLTVAMAIVLFVCLVPVPIGRIRGQALIQPVPDESESVFVIHPGILEELKVRPGQHVEAGDELARFSSRELQAELDDAVADGDTHANQIDVLRRQLEQTTDEKERLRIQQEMVKTRGDLDTARAKAASRARILSQDLVLRARYPGTVGTAPRAEDVGKYYEVDPTAPFCTIYEPHNLRICMPVETSELNRLREEERPTTAAKKARRRLQAPVSVSYQNTPLRDVLIDLTAKAKGPTLALDAAGSREAELTVTAETKNTPLATVLDQILEPLGMGYYIKSVEHDPRDGDILLRPGPERGTTVGNAKVSLPVTVRIQGRDWHTWQGVLWRLPESEAKEIPLPLSNRGGGPVAVKAGGTSGRLIPQTQQYLVFIDLINPDAAITPGNMAQVKIHCRTETCLHWMWRKVNNMFDLGLI